MWPATYETSRPKWPVKSFFYSSSSIAIRIHPCLVSWCKWDRASGRHWTQHDRDTIEAVEESLIIFTLCSIFKVFVNNVVRRHVIRCMASPPLTTSVTRRDDSFTIKERKNRMIKTSRRSKLHPSRYPSHRVFHFFTKEWDMENPESFYRLAPMYIFRGGESHLIKSKKNRVDRGRGPVRQTASGGE